MSSKENYKLCPSCSNVKTDKNHNLYSIDKVKDKEVEKHLPLFNEQTHPDGAQQVKIDLGKTYSNCLIYYYTSDTKSSEQPKTHNVSYKNTSNFGLKKLDIEGKALLNLNCPQHYKEGKNSYMSHVHILISDKNMTHWKDKQITYSVLCVIPINIVKQHIRKSDRLIINALSSEYYDKSHIPTSFNLYYKDAKKMTPNEIQKKVKDMIENHEKYKKYLSKNKIEFLEIPICVYCYYDKCTAGHQLANELYRAGFTNVIDYKGGIQEWDKTHKKKTKKIIQNK